MGNLLNLRFPSGTVLKTTLGDYTDGDGAATAADAITQAVQAEVQAAREAATAPLQAEIIRLKAENADARGVLADQIIRLKTLRGALKADDQDAILKERQYLLGKADDEADSGLSMARLVAEFNREVGQQKPQAPGTQNTPVPDAPTQLSANPFLPGATPVAVPDGTAVRPA